MKTFSKKSLMLSVILAIAFVAFTLVIKGVDVQNIGPCNTSVGLATINNYFANHLEFNKIWYNLSELLGYIAFLAVGSFGLTGFIQLVTRKNLFKVDRGIIALGLIYIVILVFYVAFDKFAINFRPVLLEYNDFPEPSYPSSHTVLSCVVMGTAIFECNALIKKNDILRKILIAISIFLLLGIVITRLLSGTHWITDIIGSILLSSCLISLFASVNEKTGPFVELKK